MQVKVQTYKTCLARSDGVGGVNSKAANRDFWAGALHQTPRQPWPRRCRCLRACPWGWWPARWRRCESLKGYPSTALVQCAKSSAALAGQVMIIENAPLRSSTLMSQAVGSYVTVAVGSLIGMNAGADVAASDFPDELRPTGWWRASCSCSLSQRCSTLAFMPCCMANAAMDAPGCLAAATISALNWRV